MTEKNRFQNLETFGFGPNVMKKLRVCLRCGQTVNYKTDICPNCDENLPKETLFDRYKQKHLCCPFCGTVLASDSHYCPSCGSAVKRKDEAFSVSDEEKGL